MAKVRVRRRRKIPRKVQFVNSALVQVEEFWPHAFDFSEEVPVALRFEPARLKYVEFAAGSEDEDAYDEEEEDKEERAYLVLAPQGNCYLVRGAEDVARVRMLCARLGLRDNGDGTFGSRASSGW